MRIVNYLDKNVQKKLLRLGINCGRCQLRLNFGLFCCLWYALCGTVGCRYLRNIFCNQVPTILGTPDKNNDKTNSNNPVYNGTLPLMTSHLVKRKHKPRYADILLTSTSIHTFHSFVSLYFLTYSRFSLLTWHKPPQYMHACIRLCIT